LGVLLGDLEAALAGDFEGVFAGVLTGDFDCVFEGVFFGVFTSSTAGAATATLAGVRFSSLGDFTGVRLLDLSLCLLALGDFAADFCSTGSSRTFAGVFLELPGRDLDGVTCP
jgi:hypothetical protein